MRGDLHLSYQCNNDCIFCVTSNRSLPPDLFSTEKMKEKLDFMKAEGAEEIVISGGEPTIREDLFEIINYIKELGIKKISLQTNGRRLKNYEFASRLAECVDEVLVSLYGPTAELHEMQTRTHGSFDDTVTGIKNLLKLGVNTNINMVLNKFNYKVLIPMIDFVISEFKKARLQMTFLTVTGNAELNFDDVVPKISEIAPFVNEAKKYYNSKTCQKLGVFGFPYCYLEDMKKSKNDLMALQDENKVVSDGYNDPNWSKDKFKSKPETYKDFFKKREGFLYKGPQCSSCKFDQSCFGLNKKYVENFGFDELTPIE